MVAELIREAALEKVRDELPHSIAVVVEEMLPREDRPAGPADARHPCLPVCRAGQPEGDRAGARRARGCARSAPRRDGGSRRCWGRRCSSTCMSRWPRTGSATRGNCGGSASERLGARHGTACPLLAGFGPWNSPRSISAIRRSRPPSSTDGSVRRRVVDRRTHRGRRRAHDAGNRPGRCPRSPADRSLGRVRSRVDRLHVSCAHSRRLVAADCRWSGLCAFLMEHHRGSPEGRGCKASSLSASPLSIRYRRWGSTARDGGSGPMRRPQTRAGSTAERAAS